MSEALVLEGNPASAQARAVAVCEAEDIRRPQRIQTFGCLLAVDGSGRVVGASANATSMLGRPLELNDDVAAVIGERAAKALHALLADGEASSRPRPLGAALLPTGLDRRFEVLAHVSQGVAIVEFIPRESERPLDPLPALETGNDLFLHCLARAERVRSLTGYDRVMIYRFHPDFSGEVIAELRNPDLAPYLGLRYPATDIPSQARALYLENRVRIIPNVHAPTTALSAARPVDLGMAGLRAVSPYHLEYLHNMRVAATLTISVVVEGALWGMVACHHGRERMLSHARQEAALAEAEALAVAVAEIARREAADAERVLKGQWSRWTERLSGARVAGPLLSGVDSIVAELRADGGAIVCGDACLGVGATPNAAWLVAAADHPKIRRDGRLVTDKLSDVEGLPPTFAAAGAVVARIDCDPPTTLFVFRRAHVQEVHWGGDPRLAVTLSEPDGRPAPRRSFAIWRELVRDRARGWTFLDRAVFATCVERLTARLGEHDACRTLADELADVAKTYCEMADSHRLLTDALPEGVAVLLWALRDGGARLLYANRAFTNLFGIELSDVVGREPEHILERTRLDPSVLDFTDADEKELDVWSSALGVRRVRARREALVRYRGPGGDSEIESLLLSDTTGASRTHDALVSAVREAQAAENARAAMLRNMSHELRTPLNAILGYSDLMAQELVGPLGDDAYRTAAEEIRSSARHLLALINDTLDLARLREGRARIDPAPHDLASVVQSATRLVSPLAAAKQIALEVSLPERTLVVDVDELAMRQVVINLVDNAIKFTPEAGRVDVVLAQEEDGGAALSVTDTGIGIPADEIGRLFIPFNQVDSTLRRTAGGTGLGLAIVKELVQLHGGKVDVVSREGVGSTFAVRLPAWRVEAGR